MAAKLPQLSGKELSRILLRLGFQLRSQKGSHVKFIRVSARGKEVVIMPNHRVIRKGTLHDIIRKLNLNLQEFIRLL